MSYSQVATSHPIQPKTVYLHVSHVNIEDSLDLYLSALASWNLLLSLFSSVHERRNYGSTMPPEGANVNEDSSR